jgi:uncharacterized protein (TIGR02271 family)
VFALDTTATPHCTSPGVLGGGRGRANENEREAAMVERFRSRVSEGMQVKAADGEKLGRVVATRPSGFVVEKGFLFPKDTLVPYERITGVSDGEIVISLVRADLDEPGTARAVAATTATGASKAVEEVKGVARKIEEAITGHAGDAKAALAGEAHAFGKAEEIRVALVEEEMVTHKHVEKIGEVHVHKEVVTEEKQITVPVTREVIRIERVPVSHEVRAEDNAFERVSYDIPVREEHVTVEKHAVVREELRVGKEILQGEETACATLRRERADVETTGSVRRAEGRGEEASNDTRPPLRPTGTGGTIR